MKLIVETLNFNQPFKHFFFHFGDDAGKGQGPAQNEVDELCKHLQQCYRCAKLDSLEDSEICRPGEIDYKYAKKQPEN